MKTLVLGLGNPYATDDAVGLRLARDLHALLGETPDVHWEPECSVGGLNLLDLIAGYDRLIVLDSVRTVDGRAGEWHRWGGSDLRDTRHLGSVHDANFATTLELGRRTGMRIAEDDCVHIFAVEICENGVFGEELSPALAREYPTIRDEVAAEVAQVLGGAATAPEPRAGGPD